MKKKISLVSKLALATVLAAGALSTASAVQVQAQCPREGIGCTDIYNPVICSNGQVYSNGCYAYIACATGCVPYGAV
jgi:hypothetical protein